MRLALGVLVLALCACQPRQACDIAVEGEIAFTGGEAADIVRARSFGASCAQAIGVYTITTHDGHPVWAWASPLPRAFGEAFAESDARRMRTFLERWAEPQILTTAAAPEWELLAPGQTTLDRLTYDDIRARNLPMLCHFAGTARQACVFWEPAAGGAGHFLDRDVDEVEETP